MKKIVIQPVPRHEENSMKKIVIPVPYIYSSCGVVLSKNASKCLLLFKTENRVIIVYLSSDMDLFV